MPVIEARGLARHFFRAAGPFDRGPGLLVKAVDGIDLAVAPGETLGLIGESGCGKTTTAKLLLDLERPSAGAVLFRGRDLRRLTRAERREYRRSVQAVFQDPQSSLNPRMSVAELVGEPLLASGGRTRAAVRARVAEVLEQVGLDPSLTGRYPHQFSGGQRQRIAIARALSVRSDLILLDEPVASLDVSVRSQILALLKELQQRLGMSYLLISHDLATAAHLCDRIAVMYLGRIVETGSAEAIYARPRHPFTRALLDAARFTLGEPDAIGEEEAEEPAAGAAISGCRYHPRCAWALPRCTEAEPALAPADGEHRVACIRAAEISPDLSAAAARSRCESTLLPQRT